MMPGYKVKFETLPLLGRFDLIIGSDLIYEPEHPQLLGGFIDRTRMRGARRSASIRGVDIMARPTRQWPALSAADPGGVEESYI